MHLGRQTLLRTLILMMLTLHISGLEMVESAVNFTLHTENVDWTTAKSRCETLGEKLAVLDTKDKLTASQEQV